MAVAAVLSSSVRPEIIGARPDFLGNSPSVVSLTPRDDLIRKDELLKPRADWIDVVRDQNRIAHIPAPAAAAPEVAGTTHTVSAGRLDM